MNLDPHRHCAVTQYDIRDAFGENRTDEPGNHPSRRQDREHTGPLLHGERATDYVVGGIGGIQNERRTSPRGICTQLTYYTEALLN